MDIDAKLIRLGSDEETMRDCSSDPGCCFYTDKIAKGKLFFLNKQYYYLEGSEL